MNEVGKNNDFDKQGSYLSVSDWYLMSAVSDWYSKLADTDNVVLASEMKPGISTSLILNFSLRSKQEMPKRLMTRRQLIRCKGES